MKRKATAEWIMQKLSSANYDTFQVLRESKNKVIKDKAPFSIAIKDHPVEFSCLLDKSFIRMMGLPGLHAWMLKLDKQIAELSPFNSTPSSLLSIQLHEVELVRNPADIKKRFNDSVLKQLSIPEFDGAVLNYSKDGLVLRYSNNNLYLALQHCKSNGVFKLVAKGDFEITNDWNKETFDLCCEVLIKIRNSHNALFKESVKQKVFIDIKKVSINQPKDLVEYIQKNLEKSVNKGKKKKSFEKVFNNMISEKPYHEMYLRNVDRKITILCAPTNAGKTYQGTRMIKDALRSSEVGQCQMLFPLRVLALQVQQDVEEDGIPCSMITGEEQDVREYSRLDAMTVEIFDTDKEYDTVFLDEGQLSFGEDRSSGYLRVICGANCKHLIIACAPSAIKQLEWYLGDILKTSYEIKKLERLTPLQTIEKPIALEDIKNGDLVVAFSRRAIHEIAEQLADMGLNVGTMYGALSPSARRAMLNQYRNNGYDVLVATDAIGMGISAPAQRVIFAETSKYDGKGTRELIEEEYRQIAGRAGRYGYAEFGEAGVLVGNDSGNLVEIISKEPTELLPPNKLYVTPDKNQLLAAEELGLVKALTVWGRAIKSNPLYQVAKDGFDELILKAEWLDQQVGNGKITYFEAVRLMYVTFPMRGRGSKFQMYKDLVSKAFNGKLVTPPIVKAKPDLRQLEDMSVDLTLMIQLSRIFPLNFPKDEQLNKQQNQLGEFIAKLLEKKYTNK